MTELERLFRLLVDNLIAIDPARLHRTMTVEELYGSIIPYRTNRRALAIDTAEDYDALLVRLLSGEGQYVEMVADEARERFHTEASSLNPDFRVLQELGHAELRLATERLAHALGPGPEDPFAPTSAELEPEQPLEVDLSQLESQLRPPSEFTFESLRVATRPGDPPRPPRPPGAAAVPPDEEDLGPSPSLGIAPVRANEWPRTERRAAGPRCSFCGGRLPANRTVNFCPHCGQNQTFTRCPECQAEIELGWKHCITCGHQME